MVLMSISQFEILDGKQIYGYNVCDEGFDIDDEIRKHIAVNRKDTLFEISKKFVEEEDDSCSE